MTELKAGRKLDALISEKIFGQLVGHKRFSCWHPGLYTDHFDEPIWQLEPFKDTAFEPHQPRMRKYSDGTAFESIITADYQEYGWINKDILLKEYSTNIAAAWEVVEKMQSLGWALILDNMKDYLGNWQAHFEKEFAYTAESESVSHAICLAALEAIGSEYGKT